MEAFVRIQALEMGRGELERDAPYGLAGRRRDTGHTPAPRLGGPWKDQPMVGERGEADDDVARTALAHLHGLEVGAIGEVQQGASDRPCASCAGHARRAPVAVVSLWSARYDTRASAAVTGSPS